MADADNNFIAPEAPQQTASQPETVASVPNPDLTIRGASE
jgi:hypothetical protein